MNGNVKQYLAGIAPSLPTEIISKETYRKINNMTNLFSDFSASEYIMETHLNTTNAHVDFSFRVLADEGVCLNFSQFPNDGVWKKINNFVDYWPPEIADIWFEMDYAEYDKQIPQPCFFFNASQIKKGNGVDQQLLFGALKQLLGNEQLELLKDNIINVINHLPPEVGLFQVGTMLARTSDQVRIFTAELTKAQVNTYLAKIGWPGSFFHLNQLLALVHPYSDGRYILDFDVSSGGISEKIGINFGLAQKQTLPTFLQELVKHQMCTEEKSTGVLAWLGSRGYFLGKDYGFTALIKNISHFKVSYIPQQGLKAKAYLRIYGIYLKDLLRARKLSYKELQDVFKQVAQRSMLDLNYRELCLRDSTAAIKEVVGNGVAIPDNIVFLEQDGERIDTAGTVYILPPFLKQSWLLSK